MASIRNIVVSDQGVAWDVTFEYSNNQQTVPWQEFTARFPRDFGEIPSYLLENVFSNLGLMIAEFQGVLPE